MTKDLSEKIMSKPLFAKNWEEDIRNVRIETCPHIEDPLGYKAVFYLGIESARAEKSKFFSIGASFLAQRAHNLVKAGYQAPMTQKAIAQVEKKIGSHLPMFDMQAVARSGF